MHLGQTATYLADVLNRPEPKMKMFARLLREAEHVEKGGRGKSAPHMSAKSLAAFLIAIMASPDSPATGVGRLTHFAKLLCDPKKKKDATFQDALALLLERLKSETWDEVEERSWTVAMRIGFSSAEIVEWLGPEDDRQERSYSFLSSWTSDDNVPAIQNMPYFGGLDVSSSMDCITLFRIAKVILADEEDPLPEIVLKPFPLTEPETA